MKVVLYYTSTLMLCLVLFGSCATIIHGSRQTVDFTSQPAGAKVSIDGKEYGKTPTFVELKRKGRLKGEPDGKKWYAVKIEMDGFYPYEIKLKRELDAWYFGNLIFSGFIGLIVDAVNGSMYKLTPDQVVAQMGKSNAYLDKSAERIYVGITLQVDPSWEKIGTLRKVGE